MQSPRGQEETDTLELFIGCEDLVTDREKTYDSFCVLMVQRSEGAPFEELQRTETISGYGKAHPQYCTSFEVTYPRPPAPDTTPAPPYFSPMLRFDVYERKTHDTERLRDHAYKATARARVADILAARGLQLSLLLHHPYESRQTGTLFIAGEPVDKSNPENESVIQFDVLISTLKKKSWAKNKKHGLSQRYEICRAHRHRDKNGSTVWLPVYRSDRMTPKPHATYLEFSTASITNRQLCNSDEERNMRLVIFGKRRPPPQLASSPPSIHSVVTSSVADRREQEAIIALADFTLRFVCEIDPTEEVLALERPDIEQEIGSVAILKAEPTDYGSHFCFRVNHEHTAKYISSAGADDKKGSGKKLKIMRLVNKKSPTAISNQSTGPATASLASGLFGSDTFDSDGSVDNE